MARTCSPGLMHGTFLLKLLSQVIYSFQAADLSQQPLFISFLHLLQTLPGIGNILGEIEQKLNFSLPFTGMGMTLT